MREIKTYRTRFSTGGNLCRLTEGNGTTLSQALVHKGCRDLKNIKWPVWVPNFIATAKRLRVKKYRAQKCLCCFNRPDLLLECNFTHCSGDQDECGNVKSNATH